MYMGTKNQKEPLKRVFNIHARVNNRLDIEYVIDIIKLMTIKLSHFLYSRI